MLHHVVQQDMFGEFGFHRLVEAFEELGPPYSVVKVVPFSHDMELVSGAWPEAGVPVMAWGMTTIEEVAKRLGWKPGVFKNANFDMRVLNGMYGDAMLNSDGRFYRLRDVPGYEGAMFLRPVHDTKSFTGGLVNGDELDKWRAGLYELRREFTTLDLGTEVMVASPKKLVDEGRFFIVGGKVVAASSYRVGGRVLYRSIDSGNPLFLQMLRFAEGHAVVSTRELMPWVPAEAFVMDVGLTDAGEYKVIEVNCLNSSGFYDANMLAVVKAIENLHDWPERW